MGPEFGGPPGLALTVKDAVVPPAGTVTLDGTVAAPVLLLDRLTTAPPLGAAALSVTVPVEELPPVTVDGLRVSEESVGGGGVRAGAADRPPQDQEPETDAEVGSGRGREREKVEVAGV